MIEEYIILFITVAFFNVLPAFAPPTWLVLAYAQLKNPELELLLIVVVGMLGALTGRTIMYFYSKYFAKKLLKKRQKENLKLIKQLSQKKPVDVFIASLIYSLSPLSSNLMFIFAGGAEINIYPLMSGFLIGRMISYSIGIVAYIQGITFVEKNLHISIGFIADIITLIVAILLMFVDWESILRKLGILKDHRIE